MRSRFSRITSASWLSRPETDCQRALGYALPRPCDPRSTPLLRPRRIHVQFRTTTMSSSPDENQAERTPGSGLLFLLQEWASNHVDTVAHESPKREALEGHQHPAYLIPREGSTVDHQQRGVPAAVRIPSDAAYEMTCVCDPPAQFPSLHVARGEAVLNA